MSTALKVTIDNRAIEVEPGTTVLNAASQAGIYIPHLCYHRKLSIKGSCRVCLIEVEGTPKLQPACSTVVCDGMRVRTDTQQVTDSRRAVLELLLINHPLDCPVCDAGGECKLQDYVFWYGSGRGRFEFEKRTFVREDVGPFVARDMNRCVHCTRCARFASEVSLAEDIGVFERGDRTSIGPRPGREFRSPFSGNVTELCPVGALTDRVFRFKARSWELAESPSSCPLCSAGCLTRLQTRGGRILRIQSREKSRTPWICDLGRFGFAAGQREATRPLVLEDGRQIEVPWDVAAQTVAGRLRTISKESGPQSIGVICGTLATNEEMFALQHVFRSVLKCGNVSFGPCTPCPAGQEERLLLRDALLAQGRVGDLAGCDSVLFLCADPCEEAPVAGLRVLQALGLASGGAVEGGQAGHDGSGAAKPDVVLDGSAVRMVAMGPRRPEPSHVQMTWVAATPRDCAGVVTHLGLELAKMSDRVGRAGELGEAAADGHAGAGDIDGRELDAQLGFWATSRKLGIVVGNELLGSPLAYGVLASVLRICAARSTLGTETVPLFLFGQGNARGALELGVLAGESSAGGGNLDPARAEGAPDHAADRAGFSGIVESAKSGKLRALFVVGIDPLAECLDTAEVREALKKVESLFVQSDTVSETAGMAQVYLPLQGIFDKKGSFMDLEGRLTGLSPQASEHGQDSLLFALLSAVCEAAGKATQLSGAEAVFAYSKDSYGWSFKENLMALSRSEGIFPSGSASGKTPDRTWLSLREFERKAHDGVSGGGSAGEGDTAGAAGSSTPGAAGAPAAAPEPSHDGEFVLLCGRAGVSRWIWARDVSQHPKIPKSLFVEIPRADAERLAIREGDTVEVVSALGRVTAAAVLSESLMPGVVFVPFGFPGPGPGVLASSRDAVTVVSLKKTGVGAECSSSCS